MNGYGRRSYETMRYPIACEGHDFVWLGQEESRQDSNTSLEMQRAVR